MSSALFKELAHSSPSKDKLLPLASRNWIQLKRSLWDNPGSWTVAFRHFRVFKPSYSNSQISLILRPKPQVPISLFSKTLEMINHFWNNQESVAQLSPFQASCTYSSMPGQTQLFLTKQASLPEGQCCGKACWFAFKLSSWILKTNQLH